MAEERTFYLDQINEACVTIADLMRDEGFDLYDIDACIATVDDAEHDPIGPTLPAYRESTVREFFGMCADMGAAADRFLRDPAGHRHNLDCMERGIAEDDELGNDPGMRTLYGAQFA